MIAKILILSTGGALGAVLRYGLGGVVHKVAGPHFPFGTLFVNVLGCFLIGFLGVFHQEKLMFGPHLKLFLMVGVLGAFTTFSAFGFETWELATSDQFIKAGLNVLLNIILCFLGLWLGVLIGRLF